MYTSDAIEEMSPKRRETLVAAWQNMKPRTSMQTLFSRCNMASAMAAVGFRKPRSKFERSLKDIRKQTSLGKKDERERRVAAFLVSLPPRTGLDDFLKVVDFPAATRALGKTYSEKWFKEYIRIIVKSVLEKTEPIDRAEDDDADQQGDDQKIVIDLTNEDDARDNISTASAGHSLEKREKRKLPCGNDETAATVEHHKRSRLTQHATERVPRSSVLSNDGGATTVPALLDFHTPVEDDGESLFLPDFVKPEPKKREACKKKTVAFAATDTIHRIPNENNGRKYKRSAFKTPASGTKGPGKAGSAPSKPTPDQLSRKIKWFDAMKRKGAQDSEFKHTVA